MVMAVASTGSLVAAVVRANEKQVYVIWDGNHTIDNWSARAIVIEETS
jgi:hypothetical protein